MNKKIKYIILFCFCIYIVSRMPVFSWGFSDDNYNAKSYDSNEKLFLMNLCEQYGGDLLTNVEVYYYGKPCKYNKGTKMVDVRDRMYY